jgi:hypothetical protein
MRIRLIVAGALVLALLLSATSQAANFTIGNPVLPGPIQRFYGCEEPCRFVILGVPAEVGMASSPVDGAVVGWKLSGADAAFGYRLLVLHQFGQTRFYNESYGPDLRLIGSSAPVTGGESPQSFETDLPIEAGDYIGLITPAGGDVSAYPTTGFTLGFPSPQPDGTYVSGVFEGQLPFNAEVQPAPTITTIGTTSGAASGGTSVVIAGTDFANVSAVKFGSNQAVSYSVDSIDQITAVAPAGVTGSVPITVTTVAGTATSGQRFTYQDPPASNTTATAMATVAPVSVPAKTCTVPRVIGKSLKGSEAKIRGADCRVGKVSKRKGASATTGKVVAQNEKPGTVLPARAVVKVTLGRG